MSSTLAPASRSSAMVSRVVVPRTMESSTTISRLPRTLEVSGLSLMRTLAPRACVFGSMNVRPT